MTVVVSLATDNFVVFAADRRRVCVDNENEFYDDMRKHCRVNNQVIIGFSGDYDTTLKCIQYLKEQTLENATVQAVSTKIRRFLKDELKKNKEMQQTVIVGGIGDGNKITLIQMNHRNNFQIDKVVPGKDHFNWRLAYANVSPEPIIEKELTKINAAKEILTVEKAIDIAAKCITYVGKQDNYISESYDVDFITK